LRTLSLSANITKHRFTSLLNKTLFKKFLYSAVIACAARVKKQLGEDEQTFIRGESISGNQEGTASAWGG